MIVGLLMVLSLLFAHLAVHLLVVAGGVIPFRLIIFIAGAMVACPIIFTYRKAKKAGFLGLDASQVDSETPTGFAMAEVYERVAAQCRSEASIWESTTLAADRQSVWES